MSKATIQIIFIFLATNVTTQAENNQWGSQINNDKAQIYDKNFDYFEAYGYILKNTTWKKNEDGSTLDISVCWEEVLYYQKERALVRNAIQASWEANANIRFKGWEKCTNSFLGVRIKINDEGSHVKALGRHLKEIPSGVVLNFSYRYSNPFCNSPEEQRLKCIRAIAIHEFGHVLGFAHENLRPDTPGECQEKSGTSGDTELTPYDPDSIMNYCNENMINRGTLSERDIASIQKLYGDKQSTSPGFFNPPVSDPVNNDKAQMD